MTTPNLPEVSALSFEELIALRAAIDARLEDIRSQFIAQASVMGLACSVDGASKRRKRRANANKDHD